MAYFIVRPQYKKSSSGGIYGVEWSSSSSTAWTRTDDAVGFADPVPQMSDGNGGWTTASSPFDNIMPWKGMVKVEDTNAGTLVAIPKFYFKLEYVNPSATFKGLKIQISPNEFEGSQVSPAHMDRGDGKGERDVVYVGRYHCANESMAGGLTSTTGVVPQGSKTRDYYRTHIHNLGSDIWQWDYAMLITIQMLYLVEFANWDSQAMIGYGCGNNSQQQNAGASDIMPYHTGTVKTSKNSGGVGVQYRNIEDLWGNTHDWVDGIRFSSSTMYVIKNPANFSDSSGGTNIGTRLTSSGWITKYTISTASGFTWAMYPSAVDSSNRTFDKYTYNSSSSKGFYVGGNYSLSNMFGLFYWFDFASDSSQAGCRLMKLP